MTERAIDALNRTQLSSPNPADRWALRRYTSAQIRHAIAHFNDLLHKETLTLKRPLDHEEQRFIQNERRLCALDFHHWRTAYAKIIDWEKHVVPFTPNVAQQIVLDVWADLERRGRAIMMIQLKARQLGVTTLTELTVAHRVQFWPRVNAVVASADPKKSVKMAGMIDFCWKEQPWWLLPRTTKVEGGIPVEFGELNSSILIQAGNQFNGVARGQTPNVVHLSELCEWDDAAQLVDAALLKAIHETPDVFVVLESTALGRGNWWHDTWKQTKEDWPTGRSRLCPIFLPWYTGIDIYPTATDLRMRPIPPDWEPSELTKQHAARARDYVLANPLLSKYLAKSDPSWTLPLSQQWYYEIERDAAIKKKQLNLFLSEMPADDQEAFQSTNISAFSPEIVLAHRERTRAPLAVYTIAGAGIPDDLTLPRRDWDLTQAPIPVSPSTILPHSTETFYLIPLTFSGYSSTGAGLRLFVWEWPEPGATYGLGVDTSDGIGQDWSVVEVLKKNFPHGPDQQVAEFASPYIKALQFWPHVLTLASLYSVYQPKQDRRVQCRVAIECRGNGESVQYELQKRGWWNFHPWKKLDNRRPTQNGETWKIGVYTSAWYRPLMMDRLLTMLEDETLEVYSPYLVAEMEALEKDERKQSLKAVFGEHDDRLMALGFVLDSVHVDDRPYGRSAYAGVRLPEGLVVPHVTPKSPYATWSPGLQALDLPGRSAHFAHKNKHYAAPALLSRIRNPQPPTRPR